MLELESSEGGRLTPLNGKARCVDWPRSGRTKPEDFVVTHEASAMNAERIRLDEAREEKVPWKKWGPYLSERQWGTVREDYSEGGDAWNYFPHDHARSPRLPLGRRRSGGHL